MTYELIRGDARKVSDLLEPASVDLIVTSPPYFALRSYRDECEACDGTGEAPPGTVPVPATPTKITTRNLPGQGAKSANRGAYLPGHTDGNGGCFLCGGTGRSHYDGQLGSEATPGEFVDALIECTRDWLKVLKPGGSIFVNLGDKRSQRTQTRRSSHQPGIFPGKFEEFSETWAERAKAGAVRMPHQNVMEPGGNHIPEKSLMGLPWRYALRCVDELGLILRADIIWHKPNGLPESVTDRVRQSHEYWFHLTRETRYFAAVDEVREAHAPKSLTHRGGGKSWGNGDNPDNNWGDPKAREINPLGKLPGSVWTVPSEPLTVPAELGVDHFAAFPSEWPRRLILGWSPTGWCQGCGEPRRAVVDVDWSKVPHRMVDKRILSPAATDKWCTRFGGWCDERGISNRDLDAVTGTNGMGRHWTNRPNQPAVPTPEQWDRIRSAFNPPAEFDDGQVYDTVSVPVAEWETPDAMEAGRHKTTKGAVLSSGEYRTILGYACACGDTTAPTRPAVVLDPFAGTGTTVAVAHHLGRHGIGIDLSRDYLRLAEWRCEHDTALRDKVLQRSDLPKAPVIDGQLALDFL